MQVPLRLLQAIRPNEHPGLLLGTAYGTAVLSVGPFLLPAIATQYGIGLGLASISTAIQLGGFVAGSWGAGRFLHPRGRVLGSALIVSVLANALSALLPIYGLLVMLRATSGIALGVISWFAWSLVFGDDRRMSEIAVVGPLVGVTTTPVTALLITTWGPEAVYLALAATALIPLALSRGSGNPTPELVRARSTSAGPTVRHRPTREASRVLLALGLLTLGGSAVFTYGAAIAAAETSLSTQMIAWSFSANALASIPTARFHGSRGNPGYWLLGCAACAVGMGTATLGPVFVVAITLWGASFWMGVPGAYSLLARCSRHPEERAGDAQAIMASGRVLGPLIGGVVLESWGSSALGFIGGGVMAVGAIALTTVHRSPGDAQIAQTDAT